MYSPLSPVSEAIYTLWQNSYELMSQVSNIWDDVPQNPQLPFVFYEVSAREQRGLGTGSLPEIEVRTHTYTGYGDLRKGQEINRLLRAVLRDQPIPIDSALYQQCGLVFADDEIVLPDTELTPGVKVHVLVSIFRIYVEEPIPVEAPLP